MILSNKKKFKNNIIMIFVIGIIIAFLFSSCIDWPHVVEHNYLRTIEEKVFQQKN